ncbi:MAG: VOC family protein [Bacteroidia bacterium]|nr:VOC family protein [Bacteroidia bacterium]
MNFIISGIQQAGIGVSNVHEAYRWYNRHLGFNVKIFEEAAVAELMLPYTGGKPQKRHAILALNMRGGGGFEIWQYTERIPQGPKQKILPGDLGFYSAVLKTQNIKAAHQYLQLKEIRVSEIFKDNFTSYFYFFDAFGNPFKVMEFAEYFKNTSNPIGGVCGMVVGVSDIERSEKFYRDVLGFAEWKCDENHSRAESDFLSGENIAFRKKILFKPGPQKGPFAPVLGSAFVELWQAEGRKPFRIFDGRQWGDLGFIHWCFDVVGMRELQKHCEKHGHPFTVDGGEGFEMGEAAGHFTYIEGPDGELIEFVETKKIPLVKKIGWYLDLKKRPFGKPLPMWMLRALALNSDKQK